MLMVGREFSCPPCLEGRWLTGSLAAIPLVVVVVVASFAVLSPLESAAQAFEEAPPDIMLPPTKSWHARIDNEVLQRLEIVIVG